MTHTVALPVLRSLRWGQRGAAVLLVIACFAGCTATGQKYVTHVMTETLSAPDADGKQYVAERSVDKSKISNLTLAPPFGSKADATHNMTAQIQPDGSWNITMGSAGNLEGGDLAATLAAAGLLLEKAEGLARALNPTTAPLLPLTP